MILYNLLLLYNDKFYALFRMPSIKQTVCVVELYIELMKAFVSHV